MAASATFALKAGVWFRRGRLFIVSPDSLAQRARCQAETPLIVLFRFLRPALSAAKYLALCTLITAWTRAKFSSPSCLVVAVALQQRGLAGGPHRFEFGIAALAKRVRPPQLAVSFMSANGNSAFIRTINSPEAHSTSHQTPAAQRRLEQRSVPGLLVARNHSPYSLSNVSNRKNSPDEARPRGSSAAR